MSIIPAAVYRNVGGSTVFARPRNVKFSRLLFAVVFLGVTRLGAAQAPAPGFNAQSENDLLAGMHRAVAYSGFREGQHPDRGEGAVFPNKAEILEDLQILTAHGFHLIRVYDSQENSREVLEVIREHALPLKVMLGVWLHAEKSNHETCAWLTEPIREEALATNRLRNEQEMVRAIALAREFTELIAAVNVGNETLVDWNDHGVPIDRLVGYLRQMRAAIEAPVTTAENYVALVNFAERLQGELDFVGVHTYPIWEGYPVDTAMDYTRRNLSDVQAAYSHTPITIVEAGWPSVASDLDGRASASAQAQHFVELSAWTAAHHITLFWFEAFDEPWKGNPHNPDGAEKHWGLWDVHRRPKPVVQSIN